VCVTGAVGNCTVDKHNTTCDHTVWSIEFSWARAAADVNVQHWV